MPKALFVLILLMNTTFGSNLYKESSLMKSIELSDTNLFKDSLNERNANYKDTDGKTIKDMIESRLIYEELPENEELALIAMLQHLEEKKQRRKEPSRIEAIKTLNNSRTSFAEPFYSLLEKSMEVIKHHSRRGVDSIFIYNNPQSLKGHLQEPFTKYLLDTFTTQAMISITLQSRLKEELMPEKAGKTDFLENVLRHADKIFIDTPNNKLSILRTESHFELFSETDGRSNILDSVEKFVLERLLSLDKGASETVFNTRKNNIFRFRETKNKKEIANNNNLFSVRARESAGIATINVKFNKLYNLHRKLIHTKNMRRILVKDTEGMSEKRMDFIKLLRRNSVSSFSCELKKGRNLLSLISRNGFKIEDCRAIKVNMEEYDFQDVLY